MIVNLVNYTKTLEAKLKLYEEDDAEGTSLFINNFLDREKIVEEEYKSKSVYFNLLKCRVIKRKYLESKDCEAQVRVANESLTEDLDTSEKRNDDLEIYHHLIQKKTLMAVISQWNIDVMLCVNKNHKRDTKHTPAGYKTSFSENEFLEIFSANVEDSFGEIQHNIIMAMRIDMVHNSLRNWEIIIELCKGF